jgi:hypothetical protein
MAIAAALTLGIIGMFIAAGIYLPRGTPPGADRPPSNGGIVVWFWTGLFWSLAIGCFLGVWGPDANPGPGGKLGGLIVGFMGLIMGAGGLFAINVRRKPRTPWIFNPKVVGTATAAAQAMSATRGFGGEGGGRIDQLEQLRQAGTLTDDEFQTLRNKIAKED